MQVRRFHAEAPWPLMKSITHIVIIKGTQVYDSSKGRFVDLSVLDVLQIFGRAGRPGLETSGEGYICTTEDKLVHYLEVVTSQVRVFHRIGRLVPNF
jgi:antiviral helicase SLH1